MSNADLIANLRGENLDCNCCAYSRSECSCTTNWPESFCKKAADALELADKRIDELKQLVEDERENAREWKLSSSAATDKLADAERKLAVAREAMASTLTMLLDECNTNAALLRAEDALRHALAQTRGE